MNEERTTKKLLAITALIFVAATLISLPYQNQVANAAPAKKYNIDVTLTGVPANAPALEVNATIAAPFFADAQEQIVSSPSDGDVVSFVFKVPSETSPDRRVLICGEQVINSVFNSCEFHPLPSSQGNKPVSLDVDLEYPT